MDRLEPGRDQTGTTDQVPRRSSGHRSTNKPLCFGELKRAGAAAGGAGSLSGAPRLLIHVSGPAQGKLFGINRPLVKNQSFSASDFLFEMTDGGAVIFRVEAG